MSMKFNDSRDFEYLSDVYVYIEQFGKKGHQIGDSDNGLLSFFPRFIKFHADRIIIRRIYWSKT